MTVVIGLFIGVCYVVAQSLVVVAAAVFQGHLMDRVALDALAMNGLVLSFCMIIGAPLAVGLSAFFAWLRRGPTVAEYLGLKRVPWRWYAIGVLSVVGLGLLYDRASVALGRAEIPEFMINAYQTAGFPPLLWLAVIVLAPLAEEIFFRGFLFKGMESSRLGGPGTIVLTSAWWAVIYLQYDWYDITTIFVLGLLLGTVRWRSGSLIPCLTMHMLVNLISTIQVALFLRG